MILVIDDYHDSAEALVRMLRKRGYPARTAAAAQEGLAVIRAHPPEQPLLVVMDEMMPHVTGVEALAMIRSEPKIAGTAVVFFTAGFDVKRREEAMVLGALGWFYKGGLEFDTTLKEIIRLYESVGGVTLQVEAEKSPQPKPQPRPPEKPDGPVG